MRTDSRDLDSKIAELSGEAAQQKVRGDDPHLTRLAPQPWEGIPAVTESAGTYYNRPMLKAPVWSIDIPIYYFLGGAAGAALTLSAALQLASRPHDREFRRLSAISHWIGIIGSTAGAGFLIHDLGRPSRFLFMLRVFRPTSPMNVGVWILSGAAPTAIAGGLFQNSSGVFGAFGKVCTYLSGFFGAALATYTGVLVSYTAIPVWQEARRWMPVLFAASGAATAGSVIDMFGTGRAAREVGFLFGTAGRLAEIGASLIVERSVSAVEQVAKPLHHGRPALLWKAATAFSAGSLALSLLPGRRRSKIARGVLGIAGSLCMRLAVHYIASASARDPHAVIRQQRSSDSSLHR